MGFWPFHKKKPDTAASAPGPHAVDVGALVRRFEQTHRLEDVESCLKTDKTIAHFLVLTAPLPSNESLQQGQIFLLKRIKKETWLGNVAIQSKNTDLSLQALALIRSTSVLQHVVLHASSTELRARCLKRLSGKEAFLHLLNQLNSKITRPTPLNHYGPLFRMILDHLDDPADLLRLSHTPGWQREFKQAFKDRIHDLVQGLIARQDWQELSAFIRQTTDNDWPHKVAWLDQLPVQWLEQEDLLRSIVIKEFSGIAPGTPAGRLLEKLKQHQWSFTFHAGVQTCTHCSGTGKILHEYATADLAQEYECGRCGGQGTIDGYVVDCRKENVAHKIEIKSPARHLRQAQP